jgi:glycosyltransferase involved in cell wall biosynthesis
VPTYNRFAPGPTFQKLFLLDLLLMQKLGSICRRHPIDVIHAHHFEGFLVSLPCRWRRRIPLVFDIHTLLEPELPYYKLFLPEAFKRAVARHLDRRAPRTADHVLTVTSELREEVVEYADVPWDHVTVATNGVAVERFDGTDPLPVRPAGGPRRLVFTGNLAAYQGIGLMLKAFRIVRDVRDDVVLQIVTEDSLEGWEREVEALGIRDAVEFHVVPFERAIEFLRNADVLINPRVDCTGVPQKLLNYMAAGKAIASFAGSARYIENEKTALVVRNADVGAMAKAILRLLDDAELAGRLGHGARRFVDGELSWDKSAAVVEGVYENVLARRRARSNGRSAPGPA